MQACILLVDGFIYLAIMQERYAFYIVATTKEVTKHKYNICLGDSQLV